LFTTPVIYLYLDRVSQWLGKGSKSIKDDRLHGGVEPARAHAAE
jgi:hypothetical protein